MQKASGPGTSSAESQPKSTVERTNDSMQVGVSGDAPDQAQSDAIEQLAHDLRTPFVSIRGYTKMILEERVGPINSTQREYLTVVAENADKAIRLLNRSLKQGK